MALLGFKCMGLCTGVSDSSTLLFLLAFTLPTPLLALSPRVRSQELQALPRLASGPRNASSSIEGLLNNRCSLSRPVLSSGVGGGVRPPDSRGRALASIWVPAGQGRGPGGDEGL